ncbi:response regulator [Rhizobacter fulvus]|jgi:DNA-binding NarL/FixJ family response regulator
MKMSLDVDACITRGVRVRGPHSRTLPALKTFVVEDKPWIRDRLERTSEGSQLWEIVDNANNEVDATAWQSENDCDLVLVDSYLRHGSGLGTVRAVASMGKGQSIVVLCEIFTTEMRRKYLELGAAAVFDRITQFDQFTVYCAELARTHRDGNSGEVK